jgi:hypothetical protein
MKHIIIGLILLVLVGAAAWIGYSIGQHHRSEVQPRDWASIEQAMKSPDFEVGVVLEQKGTFVVSFGALQKLRAGDIRGGIQEVQTLCFSAADTVYGDHPETRSVAKTFLPDFRHYLQTYCTNRADWTITQENLERKLADWK